MFDEQLMLAGTNFTAVQLQSESDMLQSLQAVRVPCAADTRDGGSEELTVSVDTDRWGISLRGPRAYHLIGRSRLGGITLKGAESSDEVADHMLVCVPGAYGVGHFPRLTNVQIETGWSFAGLQEGSVGIVKQIDDAGKLLINWAEDEHGSRRRSFNGSQTSTWIAYPYDGIVVLEPLYGSDCFGVACVRSEPGAPCRGLPSCSGNLPAWLGRLDLFNQQAVRKQSSIGASIWNHQVPLSRLGPQGGASSQAGPSGEIPGRGGDGSCPELSYTESLSNPLRGATPQPRLGEVGQSGLAVFYPCKLDTGPDF
eukprot:NODE_9430_length_1425_cov_2.862866.p1 GENE.NODE_9430_length_1425_cov_2.862866~~NODE_9430_length_1425_cov_2.862866.p1  ORF type:complete len:311 (-),score=-43.87 NODE_9430_length_1425_cov_2.862866:56-988(-)